MHHRDGGPDPTELELTAQQVIHRPTGACHTNKKYPSQPVVMGGGSAAAAYSKSSVNIAGRRL
jgi:hypothetical protein